MHEQYQVTDCHTNDIETGSRLVQRMNEIVCKKIKQTQLY